MTDTTTTATTATTATDAVREVLAGVYTAWAAGDADAFVADYLEDATVVMPGVFHADRAAVRASMAAAFAGPLRGSRPLDQPENIRVLDDHTAIVVSKAGILMAGEDQLPAERERRATWVLTRRDGRWRIAAYTNTPAR